MPPALELDHVFVCASAGKDDAAKLIRFGLQPGIQRILSGQGTGNVCFFFDNAYLEILWLHDEEEIRSPIVAPLCLRERIRWRESGACPFGIGFRQRGDQIETPEFAGEYAAPFLPPGATIPILTPRSAAVEPLVFLVRPSAGPPSQYPAERKVPLQHRGERRRLAEVVIDLPSSDLSREFGGLTMRTGRSYGMTLRFESNASREAVDFRPELPLSFEW
jgi:hypothetical protein